MIKHNYINSSVIRKYLAIKMIKYQAVLYNKTTSQERVEDQLVILGKKLNTIGSNLATGQVVNSRKIIKTIPLCIMSLQQTLTHRTLTEKPNYLILAILRAGVVKPQSLQDLLTMQLKRCFRKLTYQFQKTEALHKRENSKYLMISKCFHENA